MPCGEASFIQARVTSSARCRRGPNGADTYPWSKRWALRRSKSPRTSRSTSDRRVIWPTSSRTLVWPSARSAAAEHWHIRCRASATGASIVNTAMVSPPTHPNGPGSGRQGEQVSQGSSRLASEQDFVATAQHLRNAGQLAADLNVKISIEVHQGSIADNSTATLHLLDLVGLESVGANPDLGNIYWQYEYPEETSEAAIVALAPRAVYWHCKNLRRLHLPELNRSFFTRVPLPDGDIDYRFDIGAMLDDDYQGYLAIEGAREGDQLSLDRRGVEYVQALLSEAVSYQLSAVSR